MVLRQDLKNSSAQRNSPSDADPFKTRPTEQDFGVFYASELDGLFGGDGRAIARFKWRAVQLNTGIALPERRRADLS